MRIVGTNMVLRRLIITPPCVISSCKPSTYKEESWKHNNGENTIKPKKILTIQTKFSTSMTKYYHQHYYATQAI